jgi:hypothetical protein
LVGGGGYLVCQVAEVVFDLSEGFVLGEIDESFGHLPEQLFGVGPRLPEELFGAGLAVGGRRERNGRRRSRHGVRPGVRSRMRVEFAMCV